MNETTKRIFAILLAGIFLLSACGSPTPATQEPLDEVAVQVAVQLTVNVIEGNAPATESTAVPPQPTAEAMVNNVIDVTDLDGYTPNWSGLSKDCPTKDQFLKAHNLTASQVRFHPAPQVSWRKCQYVIELKEEFYGKVTIPQVNGWFYNEALVGDIVTNMWGGDPKVTEVTLQWGFTATWGPANLDNPYPFVDPNNPCEIVVGDFRFGLYWRLPGIGLPPAENPYYGRSGPYVTEPGNMNCKGWVPPAIDQVVADNYLQAAALYGGLTNEAEWTHSPDKANWHWAYSGKVAGSADYCPTGMPCWQTTYVPQNMKGYVEFWYQGGPKKFYASDLSFLMLDNVNPDEFTVHTSPNK